MVTALFIIFVRFIRKSFSTLLSDGKHIISKENGNGEKFLKIICWVYYSINLWECKGKFVVGTRVTPLCFVIPPIRAVCEPNSKRLCLLELGQKLYRKQKKQDTKRCPAFLCLVTVLDDILFFMIIGTNYKNLPYSKAFLFFFVPSLRIQRILCERKPHHNWILLHRIFCDF